MLTLEIQCQCVHWIFWHRINIRYLVGNNIFGRKNLKYLTRRKKSSEGGMVRGKLKFQIVFFSLWMRPTSVISMYDHNWECHQRIHFRPFLKSIGTMNWLLNYDLLIYLLILVKIYFLIYSRNSFEKTIQKWFGKIFFSELFSYFQWCLLGYHNLN